MRPPTRYFGCGKGVTYLNYTSAGSIGFFGFVVPGTLRDSMVILDGLLEQHTSLRPTMLVTDSASYSDIVFGLFMLLGYRFCPRLGDLGDTRFYRINPIANYGALNGVARYRINTDLIARHWDDLLRVAGSLKLGVVSGHDLMRTFQGTGRNSSLARALAEYARIGKTLHLLDLTRVWVRPDEASSIQEVRFLRRQGPASQRQSSFASWKATSTTKRKQSDRQAATRVK